MDCAQRDELEPLRQGDVFRWNNRSKDPRSEFGIVVTADCDLAQAKHRDILSYCPLLELGSFLNAFWLPDDLRRATDKQAAKVAERLTAARRRTRPEYDADVSGPILVGWVRRRGAEGVLRDATGSAGDRQSISADLSVLATLLRGTESDDSAVRVEALIRYRAGNDSVSQVDREKHLDAIWKDYRSRLRNLPGDLFAINGLSPSHPEGYVAYLRRVREIAPESIALRPADERRGLPATRIGRLRTPYRFRLTQKLAAVFADIGLPPDYDGRCAESLALAGLQLNSASNA